MTTLNEILAKYPAGSDERLAALEAWRRSEDERLSREPRPVKMPPNKRDGRPPAVIAPALPVASGDEAKRRLDWEKRRDETERAKEAADAAAIKARVRRAVALETVRINALADMSTRRQKLARTRGNSSLVDWQSQDGGN